MRTWLYDRLTTHEPLWVAMGADSTTIKKQVVPRESQFNVNLPKPFLMYGLGNETNESLSDEPGHRASRQFFQIWAHDEGGSFDKIDSDLIPLVKDLLIGASDPASMVTTILWLETSGEFSNETYNTIFRYIRFQAIISKGALTS